LLLAGSASLADHDVTAFAPTRAGIIPRRQRTVCSEGPFGCRRIDPVFMSSVSWDENESCVLSDEEVAPLLRFDTGGKEKIINAFGLWTFVVSLITCPIWAAAMWIVDAICKSNEELDPHRSVYDGTGKIWSKAWLTMAMSYPTITGDVDRLREGKGACLYVANHASWLDIPVVCTVLDPVFKFISKAELAKLPCIGQQLSGGNHILIERDDRRSQLKTFKDGIAWLKKGVPLMAFPEGKRSLDGRLMDFKGGIFSMAVKTKVPIVPISIANTHAVMPSNALFPVQNGAEKLHVHVHEAIDTEGLSEAEIADAVRAALLSKLPKDQHPIEKEIPEGSIPSVDEILQQKAERVGDEKKMQSV